MNITKKIITAISVCALAACSQPEPEIATRGGVVKLPADYINVPVNKNKHPISLLDSYESAKLVINSNSMFQPNQTPLKRVTFQKYSSEVFTEILNKISQHPENSKIDVKVYRFGNFPSEQLTQLSEIQAQTICALLWDYGNISSERITCKGMGKNGKRIINATDFTTNASNNRIEITLS